MNNEKDMELTDKQIEKILDYDGWISYKNGSEKFKQAVKMGLVIQIAQLNNLSMNNEKKSNERNNRKM